MLNKEKRKSKTSDQVFHACFFDLFVLVEVRDLFSVCWGMCGEPCLGSLGRYKWLFENHQAVGGGRFYGYNSKYIDNKN